MVNRERLVNDFLELVAIDSLSRQEREVADRLIGKLKSMGIEVYEDDAGKKIGGNTGNLICTLKGTKDVPAILFSAHMDTVTPGIGKKAVMDGSVIHSDGTTVLGADDVSGITAILEAIRLIQESGAEHGDIQIAFTVAEEVGLLGAKNLDYSKIYAKYAVALDAGGQIGATGIGGPSQNIIDVVITGKAAHAGVAPQKGVSAIQIAADAISHMRLGLVDEETTANIGSINGGKATNIVCDRIEIKAEARSRNDEKLDLQTEHMRQCFLQSAYKFGGSVEFQFYKEYPRFSVSENDELIAIMKKAAPKAGVNLVLEVSGGGSDINVLNDRGITAVDTSTAMHRGHTVEEFIDIEDLVKATEFVVEIIKAV